MFASLKNRLRNILIPLRNVKEPVVKMACHNGQVGVKLVEPMIWVLRPKIGCNRHHRDEKFHFFFRIRGFQSKPTYLALESGVVGRFKLIKIRRLLWISDSALGSRVHFFSFTFGGFWIFGSDFFFGRVNHCVHSADRIRKERALNLRRLVFSKAWFIQPLVGFGMWYDHKSILTGHRSNYWGLFVSNLFAEFTSKYYTLEN